MRKILLSILFLLCSMVYADDDDGWSPVVSGTSVYEVLFPAGSSSVTYRLTNPDFYIFQFKVEIRVLDQTSDYSFEGWYTPSGGNKQGPYDAKYVRSDFKTIIDRLVSGTSGFVFQIRCQYPPPALKCELRITHTICPEMPECVVETCNLCNTERCIVHVPHYSGVHTCFLGAFHFHCSNSQSLVNQWLNAVKQTLTCESCGGKICPLCPHSCEAGTCPDLPSCEKVTCSVCGSEYCTVHTFHLCSNVSEFCGDLAGIVSSQTNVSGSANVNVNFDASGLESAINTQNLVLSDISSGTFEISDKLDSTNSNLSQLSSNMSQFHSDYKTGANQLHADNIAAQGLLGGIGSGIGDLNTGMGDLNTGIGDLNTGVEGLGESVDGLGESLEDQTEILDDILDSLRSGTALTSESLTGGNFQNPDIGDSYEFDVDLSFFDSLREKLAFPTGYFDIGSSDFVLDVPLVFLGQDYSFSIDFNSSMINPLRVFSRAFSSFVMVLFFALSVIRTLSLW